MGLLILLEYLNEAASYDRHRRPQKAGQQVSFDVSPLDA